MVFMMNIIEFFSMSHHVMMVLIEIHQLYHDLDVNPTMNPTSKLDCPKMFQVTYLHACQPSYYSNVSITLYFVKYNNSIPFSKEQLCQVNKVLLIVAINSFTFPVDLMYILVQNLRFSSDIL